MRWSETRAYLVGSSPAGINTPQAAAQFYLDALAEAGRLPVGLPGGETSGLRHNWCMGVADALAEHPALTQVREADPARNRFPAYTITRPDRLTAESLRPHLGYLADARAEHPVITAERDARGLTAETLPYQLGVASPLVHAMMLRRTLAGRTLWPRRRALFATAVAHEIAAVQAATGGDVLIAWELPIEVIALHHVPPPARPAAARRLARNVTRVVRAADAVCARDGTPPARFAAHLCTGDWNRGPHRTQLEPADLSGMTTFANALTDTWPADRPALELMHIPAAHGEHPAPTRPGFYAPLRDLRLPAGTTLALGHLHEDSSSADLRQVQDAVSETLRDTTGVDEVVPAAACGDGRRDLATTQAMLAGLRTAAQSP